MTEKLRSCAKCKGEFPADGMRRYPSGGISKLCVGCHESKVAKPKVKAKKTKRVPQPDPAPSPSLSIKVAPEFGFEAEAGETALTLKQFDAAGNVDNIILSKSETVLLIAQFSEWAHA